MTTPLRSVAALAGGREGEMGDVKVTREHREAAIRALWREPVECEADVLEHWLDTGGMENTYGNGVRITLFGPETYAAEAIADAEARGSARERAAIVDFGDRMASARRREGAPSPALDDLMSAIERGDHVRTDQATSWRAATEGL